VSGSAPMIILEIYGRAYAAYGYVRVVEGSIRNGREAKQDRRCYD
jgi:hypothetical protein